MLLSVYLKLIKHDRWKVSVFKHGIIPLNKLLTVQDYAHRVSIKAKVNKAHRARPVLGRPP